MGAVAVELPPFARQFDRALVGLGARVGEEDLVETTVFDQQIGQFEHWAIVESRAAIDQRLSLGGQRLDQSGMAVPQTIDRPALDKI